MKCGLSGNSNHFEADSGNSCYDYIGGVVTLDSALARRRGSRDDLTTGPTLTFANAVFDRSSRYLRVLFSTSDSRPDTFAAAASNSQYTYFCAEEKRV
jgi:hypothetical protein